MKPSHYTNLARLIGTDCRYEWCKVNGEFRWNFYQGGQKVASIKKPLCVITTAEKIALANGK